LTLVILDLFIVDDACFYCYLFVTSSAARGSTLLISHYALSILFVKAPDYNCFIFLQRLIITTKKNITASYYIHSIHHFSLFIAIQILSNHGILRIPNLSVLTSRPGTE
jgi:hypothetical protein